MSANEMQVGGNHYEANYQHWDLMLDLKTPCPVVYASKYVYRWRKKNGVQDLEKAVHCLRKAEESKLVLEKNSELVEEFLYSNRVHTNDAHALRTMLAGEFKTAISIINVLMTEEKHTSCEASPAYVNQ